MATDINGHLVCEGQTVAFSSKTLRTGKVHAVIARGQLKAGNERLVIKPTDGGPYAYRVARDVAVVANHGV